jgi:hypothetical protein
LISKVSTSAFIKIKPKKNWPATESVKVQHV